MMMLLSRIIDLEAEVARLQHFYDIAEQARLQQEAEVARLTKENDRLITSIKAEQAARRGAYRTLSQIRSDSKKPAATPFTPREIEDGVCPKCGGEFGKHEVPDCDEKPPAAPRSLVGEEQMLDEIEAENPKGDEKP